MNLLIYLPALNEEEHIADVISNLPRQLQGVDIIQYLVIDDGSKDRTRKIALSSGVNVISHGSNRGVGAAFQSAVQFALEKKVDVLVGIDADGQFDPEEIAGIIQPIIGGKADMVTGNRFASGRPRNMSKVKYWGNQRVAKIVAFASGQRFKDVSCGFRAYSREVLLRLNLFGTFTYTHETILSAAYQDQRIIEYPVSVRYYPERKSRMAASIPRYAVQTGKIIFRVMLDYRPMRVFGTLGSFLIGIGSIFVFFLLGHYAFTRSFTPYKSFGFIGLGFFIFGLLVFLLALIADMINRVRVNQDKLLYELKKQRDFISESQVFGK